jgi:hypothetical protein
MQQILMLLRERPSITIVVSAALAYTWGWVVALMAGDRLTGALPDGEIMAAGSKALLGHLVLGLLVAPIAENLVAIKISQILVARTGALFSICSGALALSILHALFNVWWGVLVFIPFVLFVGVFWFHEKEGRFFAISASVLSHVLFNVPGAAILIKVAQ